MTPPMLRQLWSVIEQTQTNRLIGMDDASLSSWLISELRAERPVDSREADMFSAYIRSRITLIRDLAQAR
ncbi:MAG: hypothetical protein ACFE0J_00215 [Elainellaceae cyanobacterium]